MNETKFVPTMTTRYFDVNMHLIWKLGLEEANIQTPEGYSEKKTDTIRIGKQIYIRRFFVNNVPVIATLYENEETKEIGYFFEGTRAEIEKVKIK